MIDCQKWLIYWIGENQCRHLNWLFSLDAFSYKLVISNSSNIAQSSEYGYYQCVIKNCRRIEYLLLFDWSLIIFILLCCCCRRCVQCVRCACVCTLYEHVYGSTIQWLIIVFHYITLDNNQKININTYIYLVLYICVHHSGVSDEN